MLPFMLFLGWWVPEYAVKETWFSLQLPFGPGWISVHFVIISSDDLQFVFHLMFNSWGTVWQCFDSECKATKVVLLGPELVPVPPVEVSEDWDSFGSWCPFQKCDITIWLFLEAILIVRSSNLINTTLCSLENVEPSIKIVKVNTYSR